MEPDEIFYPDLLCHRASLRPGSAPRIGCFCAVCKFFTTTQATEGWVPVVKRRDPFIGVLERVKT